MHIHQYLKLNEDDTISCTECGEVLCSVENNYKKFAAINRTDVGNLGPAFSPPEEIIGYDPEIELRQYFCPNCGILLDHQVAKTDDPIIHDIEIDLDSTEK